MNTHEYFAPSYVIPPPAPMGDPHGVSSQQELDRLYYSLEYYIMVTNGSYPYPDIFKYVAQCLFHLRYIYTHTATLAIRYQALYRLFLESSTAKGLKDWYSFLIILNEEVYKI